MSRWNSESARAFGILAICLTIAACQSDAVSASDALITDPLSTVLVNPASGSTSSIGIGDSVRLDPTVTTRRSRIVNWNSSNESVARVNSQGLVVATGVGSATVTATGLAGSERWSFTVGKSIGSIYVNPDSVVVTPGTSAQLTVVISAADGTVITGRPVTFRSLNTSIATVTTAGLVRVLALGATSVVITAGSASKAVGVRGATVATTPPIPTTPTTPTPPTSSGALGLNAAINTRSLFPASNAWNQPVDTAQVDANSSAIITNIGATKSFHPDFGANYLGGPFGIPYFVVSGSQAGVNVTFDYDDESDHGLYKIPANAPIEGGASSDGDRHVLIVDRDNWKLYELYYAFPNSNGSWRAGSGAIFDLASNALRPAGWTSADAAGLPVLPGLVRYDEVSAGEITHALRFTVSRSRHAYVPPARHYASSDTSSLRPPMGMRVRLKASVNISGYPASAQVILRALKKYGMIVADNGSDWYISGTADARWNDNEINTLKALKGSDFEVIKMTGVVKN